MVSKRRERVIWDRWLRFKTHEARDSLPVIRQKLEVIRRNVALNDFVSPSKLRAAVPDKVWYHQLRVQELEHESRVLYAQLVKGTETGLSTLKLSRIERKLHWNVQEMLRQDEAIRLSKKAVEEADRFVQGERDMDDINSHIHQLESQERRLQKRGEGIPDKLERDILSAEAEHARLSINYHTLELKLGERYGLFLHGRDISRIRKDIQEARESWRELKRLI